MEVTTVDRQMSAPRSARRAASLAFVAIALLSLPALAPAESRREDAETETRYMAMGDSIAAGRGAMPQTEGYVYLLYRWGAIDDLHNTHLSNAAVSEATSANVLFHQLPQALPGPHGAGFRPDVITITVGGNDLLALLEHPDPTDPRLIEQVLSAFAQNMVGIFTTICKDPHLRKARVFVSNQYAVPEIDEEIPGASFVVQLLNQTLATVARQFRATIVDVHGAFEGRRGLLQGERRGSDRFERRSSDHFERSGSDRFEVHPTDKGHQVIARLFRTAMAKTLGVLTCID
jgi:lysophospholipase L1-like esterase